MKKIGLVAVFVIAVSIVSMACEIYDGGLPSKDVRKEFKLMYPDAKDIEWDREGTYWSVSFETGSFSARVDHEALFSATGKWVMTETDVFVLDVPEKIKDALAASPEYGTLQLDDDEVEYYQTPSGNFYRFDMISGGRDIKVDVTEDGVVSAAKRSWF